ncbi:MAG: efflux RND transporter periplasmic adaptor subunit [Rubripirellula sp.]
MRGRLAKLGTTGLAILAFGLISLFAASQSDTLKTLIAALLNVQPTPLAAPTNVTTVQAQTIEDAADPTISRDFSGVFIASQSSDLGFKRTGRLMELLVDQGDSVAQGDVLAILDTDSLIADAAVLKAKKRAAEAKLAELVAGPRRQTISAAKAKLNEYASLRDQSQSTAERSQRLINGNAVSRQEADDANFELSASLNRYQAQLQVLQELEAGTRPEVIDAQKATVEELEAQLNGVEVQIRESKLIAPYDAIVSKRFVDMGVVVAPESIILRIVERKPPEAWIGLPPDVAASLKQGVDYELVVNDQPIVCRLKSVLPELDPATRTQTSIFETAPNSPPSHRPTIGQVAQLKWERSSQHDGYWIPTTALTRGVRGLWSVFVIEPAEAAAEVDHVTLVVNRRDVEVLQVETDRVLVRGTIRPGDRIVSAGGHRLAPGQRVQLPSGNEQDIVAHESPSGGN